MSNLNWRIIDSNIYRARRKAFEDAASDALNPKIIASKVSEKSRDHKKYDFSAGLQRDLSMTRAALHSMCHSRRGVESSISFGDLFSFTGGQIANLNRVLQNLKREGEIDFEPECFFIGKNDYEKIILLPTFWKKEYQVDTENVFRVSAAAAEFDTNDEKPLLRGRSYVEENLATMKQNYCSSCFGFVQPIDRLTIRSKVYHLHCLQCTVCGANPRKKMDYLTFDGNICCSSECVAKYDAAHIHQERR